MFPRPARPLASLLPLLLVLVLPVGQAAADPVVECRERHRDAPAAHIVCLETALRAAQRRDGRDDADRGERDEAAAWSRDRDAAAPSGLGAEQVRSARERQSTEDDSERVRIVAAHYDVRGLGTFHLANGQVWRETTRSPERRHLDPDREYEARIVRARLSGYRLHVDGMRWMKTVERLE